MCQCVDVGVDGDGDGDADADMGLVVGVDVDADVDVDVDVDVNEDVAMSMLVLMAMAMAMVMMVVDWLVLSVLPVSCCCTQRPAPPASLLCLVAPAQTSRSRKLSRTVTGNYFSFGQNDRHRRAENYFTWAP